MRKPAIIAPLALEAVPRFDAIFAAERALTVCDQTFDWKDAGKM